MFYKDDEIVARVHETGSDLYTLTDKGELDKSCDLRIDHNDQEIVWYEVVDMAHLHVEENGKKLYFTEIPTIEEAKRRIDLYDKQNKWEGGE